MSLSNIDLLLNGKTKTRFIKLINVLSSTQESTSLFKNVKHDELVNAFRYWFEQSRLFFGEPLIVQGNQSRNDAGVDILLHFTETNNKIGIQIKSHYDISEPLFQKNVKSQIVDRLRHSIDFFLIGFAGDLTNKSHIEKVGRMISEISQTKDNSILILQPEQLLPIYLAYVRKDHPLKYVNLDYSDCMALSKGMRESLLTDDNEVSIKIKIKNKNKIKNKMYNFSIDFLPHEHNMKKIDEIKNLTMTDDVLTIYPHELDFKAKNFLSDNEETSKVTMFKERPNRFPLFLDSIMSNGETIRHDIIYDKYLEENTVRYVDVSDRTVKINITHYNENGKGSIHPSMDYEKLSSKDMKTLLEDIKFWYSVSMAKENVLSQDNHKKMAFKPPYRNFPPYFTEIVFLLSKLETFTNKKFNIKKEDLTIENLALLRLLTDSIENRTFMLNHFSNQTIECTVSKRIALVIFDYFKNKRIQGDACFKLQFKPKVLNQEVFVELPINLFKIELIEDIELMTEKMNEANMDEVKISFKAK